MNHSWPLGRLAGIDVRIHWTFLLLPVWVYFSSLAAGSGAVAASVSVAFVLSVFGCIVLHELGHALTARQFGIQTSDITLLPIGGVASLERMPRSPWQELAIAIAGPAVNVAIAASFLVGLPILAASSALPVFAIALLSKLAWVNVALVVFNMLPAFPMDGGRVLRATLALTLPYRTATRVAVGVGQVVAIGLAIVGLMTGNLLLMLLAGFVFLAAQSEVMLADQQLADSTTAVNPKAMLLDSQGNEIAEIPSRPMPVVSAQWNASNVLGWLSSDSVDEFFVSSHGMTVAIVRKCDLRRAVKSGLGSQTVERLLAGHVLPFRNVAA
ncbi:putative zinc metalloprotease Rip3 [Novipirellula aureliae]|uniref:Putative zinc metalloprotease Rip3 n=1 Tax=Novipirellula aureliae TaxID=2527966 RepID=A0A5C6DK39_9BACT|nr:site-2 protease family protein [Novipirellula aureliae]TWU35229.1 putative zinc metalloprotease Rip3 [Novipirellula aureliae]